MSVPVLKDGKTYGWVLAGLSGLKSLFKKVTNILGGEPSEPCSSSFFSPSRWLFVFELLLVSLFIYSPLANAALSISPSQTGLTQEAGCDPTIQTYISDIVANGSVSAVETTPGTGFFKMSYPANTKHSLLQSKLALYTSAGAVIASGTTSTLLSGAGFKSVTKTAIANGNYFVRGVFVNGAKICYLRSGLFSVAKPFVSGVTPPTGILNQAQNYTVNGSNLPSTLAFTITHATGCGQVSFSSTRVVFNCTPRLAGAQTYTVKTTSGGTPLKSGPITVSTPTPTPTVSTEVDPMDRTVSTVI